MLDDRRLPAVIRISVPDCSKALAAWASVSVLIGPHARDCAQDLMDILSMLYDYLLDKQAAAIKDPDDACKAKVLDDQPQHGQLRATKGDGCGLDSEESAAAREPH